MIGCFITSRPSSCKIMHRIAPLLAAQSWKCMKNRTNSRC
ncbi:hypothetical protein TKK_0014101 [Trichogramma kaykai]